MVTSTKTASDLEWPQLLERIAQGCLGPDARARTLALEPAGSLAEASASMQRTTEACQALEADEPIPADAVPETLELLDRIALGSAASALELGRVARLLEVARELRRFARAHRAEYPTLAAALDSDPGLDVLLDDLRIALDPAGGLSDDASPLLRQARRRASDSRARVIARLERLMSHHSDVLRDEYYDVREGRYVLPVRSDAHIKIEGIVLGSSASGGTLYVEPREITPLGNALKVAESEISREEARILLELSTDVRDKLDEVRSAKEASIQADQLAAIARWAREIDATPIAPREAAGSVLRQFRHPLLPADSVVANDITLEAGTALLVSGPNAGGKTVALKCLGLAAWMVRAGLPLPASPESEVGWFDQVLTDVGDEQSLARSLSTFSAHVSNLAAILGQANPRTLVLLDEIAAGTDPEEGAALAAAVLQTLVDRGAAVATTTHYERLKEFATGHDKLVNASVGFDFDRMEPTFSLAMGIPGPSSALAVAARYGIEPDVIAAAQRMLPKDSLEREDLVGKLQKERRALEEARAAAEADAREQARLRAELETERKTVRIKERERLAREGRELTARVTEARGDIERARRSLRSRNLTKSEIREIERDVDAAARHVAIGSPLTELARSSTDAEKARSGVPLAPGDRVRVRRLGPGIAQVLETATKGHVRVLAGALKVSVPVEEVVRVDGSKPAPKTKAVRIAPSPERQSDPIRTSLNTLDLRGHRVEEALDRVDAFLDHMLSSGEATGFVLHGHGTGALKDAVRVHLDESAYVERHEVADDSQGGDALTVFWLRG